MVTGVNKTGLTIVHDHVAALDRAFNYIADTRVAVGIPSTRAGRENEDGQDINNAALGYIHENGAPEVGLPPRPHLIPGILRVQSQTEAGLRRAAEAAMDGDQPAAERSLNAVGLRAASSVKQVLREGVPPPIQDDTIRNRRFGRQTKSMRPGEKEELRRRASGQAPAMDLVKPLINSAQLLNSYTYVLRKR